jgi:hypothetical protein
MMGPLIAVKLFVPGGTKWRPFRRGSRMPVVMKTLATDVFDMAIVFDPNRKLRIDVDEPLPTMREGNPQNEELLTQSYERISSSGLFKEESLPRKMSEEPSFTPYTDMPQLENRKEVAHALVRSYPRALRDAGICGTALVWGSSMRRGKSCGRNSAGVGWRVASTSDLTIGIGAWRFVLRQARCSALCHFPRKAGRVNDLGCDTTRQGETHRRLRSVQRM